MFGIGGKKDVQSAVVSSAELEEMIHVVHASLNRCLANDRFMEIFYEGFMKSDDEIRQMFSNTDFDKQKKLLRKALLSAVTFAAGGEVARERLSVIRATHNRAHMNVRPELYPFWVDSLIQAVAACDTTYNERLDAEWRAVLKPTIDFITSGYME